MEFSDFVIYPNGKTEFPEGGWDLKGTDDKLVLMQYTGLKDKNGVEIYENDIVENEKGDRAIIDYSETSTRFQPRSYYGAGENWCYQKNTVVGNIYENPELLEEK